VTERWSPRRRCMTNGRRARSSRANPNERTVNEAVAHAVEFIVQQPEDQCDPGHMLVMPSGERRWPLLSSADIEALLAIAPSTRQYQFVQKARDLIELRLAVAETITKSEEARLAGWVRAKFGVPFRIVFTYLDESR
jgi:hypothetical protein